MVRLMIRLMLIAMGLPHMKLLISKGQKTVSLIHIEVCLYRNNCRNRKNSNSNGDSGSANRCNNNTDTNQNGSSDINSNSNSNS